MKLSILQVNTEDLSPHAIVCGDPFRAEAIARKLDNVRELAFSREYRTFVGEASGVAITVVSHGVGSPGAAVCFEELIKGGVKTLIRVGTAGSYSADVPPGSLVVSTAAVREDGLTRQLAPLGFPQWPIQTLYERCLKLQARRRVLSKGDYRHVGCLLPRRRGIPS